MSEVAVALVVDGLFAALQVSRSTGVGLAVCLVGKLGYSLWLKYFVVIDMIALALLYGVHIGMSATEPAWLWAKP